MRTRALSLSVIVLMALAVPVVARRAPQRGVGLEVFDDINFRGRSATIVDDAPDLRRNGLDGRISSLRVVPGDIWQVCAEPNYEGRCQVFSDDQSDLRKGGWNDAIMSIRRIRGGRGGGGRDGGGGGGGGGTASRGLELYAGTRYSGQRVVVEGPEVNLRRLNFNDRASSLRIGRGEVWEVCVNADFDDCRVIDGDIPDLSVLGLNREVSSARPRRFGGGGPGRARIILYDERGFRGRATTIEEDTPSLGWVSNTAGSIQVVSGRWEVCEEVRYSGRCALVTQDLADLSRLGLRDRISSVRRR